MAEISSRYVCRVLSLTRMPSKLISPESGLYSPASNFRSVDLPDPLPPVMNTNSPESKVKSIGPT